MVDRPQVFHGLRAHEVQGVNHPPDTCDSVDGGPSPSGTELSGRPVIVCCLPRGRATPSAGAGKQARPSRTAARQARHAVLCRRPHGQTFMLMSHSGQLGPMTPTLSPRCSPICCHALCMVAMVSDTCGGAGRGAGCGHGTQLWEHGGWHSTTHCKASHPNYAGWLPQEQERAAAG